MGDLSIVGLGTGGVPSSLGPEHAEGLGSEVKRGRSCWKGKSRRSHASARSGKAGGQRRNRVRVFFPTLGKESLDLSQRAGGKYRRSMTRLVLDAILDHADARPDAPAMTWLVRGEGPEATWSFSEVARRLAAAAAVVREVAGPGDPVLVVTPESLEQTVGVLGTTLAGAIPVPLHLPEGPRAPDVARKLQKVAQDVRPVALLTTRGAREAATAPLAGGAFATLPVTCLDEVPLADDAYPRGAVGEEAVAWLQYTSGSTGDPKGVVVRHGAMARNVEGIDRGFGYTDDSVVLHWLPGGHDLGLVWGIMQPLWRGLHLLRMSPTDFARRPGRWMSGMHRWGATHSASPDFGFALAAARTAPEDLEGVDLSHVRCILNGAEPVRKRSEDSFQRRFGPYGMKPGVPRHAYGMAEAVLVMSKEDVGPPCRFREVDPDAMGAGQLVAASDPARAHTVAGNGLPIAGMKIRAVDVDTREVCPPDVIGELWVHGRALGSAYHGRPEASQATFGATTADGVGPWLRTGDLGAIGPDGVVYVTGRIKDLIVVRGANHHAEDLEHTLEPAHPSLRPGCAVCVSLDSDDGERLAVFAEVRPAGLVVDEVIRSVRATLAREHGVAPARVVLLAPRAVPRTSSGKRQRHETAARWARGELDVLGSWERPDVMAAFEPSDDLRTFLRSWVRLAVGLAEEAAVDDTPLRDLGLDSLELTELAESLSARLGRTVSVEILFAHPTLSGLVQALEGERASDADSALSGRALREALEAELDGLE